MHDRVVHVVYNYPSREDLPEYRESPPPSSGWPRDRRRDQPPNELDAASCSSIADGLPGFLGHDAQVRASSSM